MHSNRQQLKYIQKIIDDEVWLESEKRGYPVARDDPFVLERVSNIIVSGAGAWMRQIVESGNNN
jgi:hypothetical protein